MKILNMLLPNRKGNELKTCLQTSIRRRCGTRVPCKVLHVPIIIDDVAIKGICCIASAHVPRIRENAILRLGRCLRVRLRHRSVSIRIPYGQRRGVVRRLRSCLIRKWVAIIWTGHAMRPGEMRMTGRKEGHGMKSEIEMGHAWSTELV